MKSKLKTKIAFKEAVDIEDSFEDILNVQNFVVQLYLAEGLNLQVAKEKSTVLVFSRAFNMLGGKTPAQWLAAGGNERKVQETLKLLVSESLKQERRQEEQQQLMAQVNTKRES